MKIIFIATTSLGLLASCSTGNNKSKPSKNKDEQKVVYQQEPDSGNHPKQLPLPQEEQTEQPETKQTTPSKESAQNPFQYDPYKDAADEKTHDYDGAEYSDYQKNRESFPKYSDEDYRNYPSLPNAPLSPIVIFNGGKGACDRNFFDPTMRGFSNLRHKSLKKKFAANLDMLSQYGLDSGVEFQYILSCFSSFMNIHIAKTYEPENAKIKSSARDNFLTRLRGNIPLEKVPTTFANYLSEAIPAGHPVILVGHSYGGWLSMKLAEELKARMLNPVATLITVDAVSPITCNPGRMKYSGCREYPDDIGPAALNLISNGTIWHNFYLYKKRFGLGDWIMSEPIMHAHTNTEICSMVDFDGSREKLDHASIILHPAIWHSIADSLFIY